jgi:hypothetical protein
VGRGAHVERPANVVTNIPSLPKFAHVGIGSIFRGFRQPQSLSRRAVQGSKPPGRSGLKAAVPESRRISSALTQFTPATNRQLLKARTCLRNVA